MQARAEVHLFLSPGGRLLPRWQEAFRDARAADSGDAAAFEGPPPRLTWVRLQHDVDPAQQIAGLPEAVRTRPFIVLSDLPEDEEALAVFAAGARGYANTHAAPLVLRSIAGVVLQGGLWIGESLMQRLLRATSFVPGAGHVAALGLSPPAGAPAPTAIPVLPVVPPPSGADAAAAAWLRILTDRERQVALRVAHGESNKEVARALGVTERTVKAHVGAVLEKLRVRDRLQLSLVVTGRTQPPPR